MPPTFHLLPGAPKPVAPYSHAVEAGGFVFVTGQLATDPDDDARPMPEGVNCDIDRKPAVEPAPAKTSDLIIGAMVLAPAAFVAAKKVRDEVKDDLKKNGAKKTAA